MNTRHTIGAEGPPISVVLVEDQALIRRFLSVALSGGGISVVGEAGSGEAGITMVTDVRPDVVVMDLGLPGISGIEAIEQLGLVAPASRILVLTGGPENLVVEAIVAGASGYILKDATPEAVISAVRATAAGESVLSPEIAGKLLQRVRERDTGLSPTGDAAAIAIRAALTHRELEIFQLLASGESNQTIGLELSLSPNTVSNHIASILAKLQLENRIQAAVQAVRSGIA
jgi:DNA-binding NarL/FixJ family response regulator